MENPSTKKILIGVIILIVAAGAVFGFRHFKQVKKNNLPAPVISAEKVRGPESAPIQILDFSDFQCPACRIAAPILEMFMEKYPGKIHLVFKHFPLRSHPWSPVAHQAAECASSQGKFWEFYRKVYENQPVWATLPDPMVSFITYAQEVGVNMDSFAGCMTNSAIAEKIAAEKKEGEALEVGSTPCFFINGKMFAGPSELKIGGEQHIRKILGLPPEPEAQSLLASEPSPQPAAQSLSTSAPEAQPVQSPLASASTTQPAEQPSAPTQA